MGRRSRKSKRRLNSLFLTLLLTAVLLIMSTYAWFSSNREVEIKDITAKVVAAEGLQISLDAVKWGTSVSVTGANLATAGQTVTSNGTRLCWPEELEPVSTVGETGGGTDVIFKYGLLSDDGANLSDINKAEIATTWDSTNNYSDGKYIAFDVYLKNSSSRTGVGTDIDQLYLNNGSLVRITPKDEANNIAGGVANTGLENSVRVGFALYSETANFTDSKATIQGLGGTPKVAIWEPNYDQHISEITSNDTRVSANASFVTLGLTNNTNNGNGIVKSATAITGQSQAQDKNIRTGGTVAAGENTEGVAMTDVSTTPAPMTLAPNQIMRLRVYIWLEGQDPDCIDTASTGKQFDTIIKLGKPKKTN